MARIFTDGGELGNTMLWTSSPGVSAGGRSGSYYYRLIGLGAGNQQSGYFDFSARSEIYFRVGFMWGTPYSPNEKWIQLRSGANTIFSFDMDTATNLPRFYVGTTTLVLTGITTILQNTWSLLEVHLKIADSGGIIEAKVDGISQGTFTGDTKPGADTTVGRCYVAPCGSAGGSYCSYDDFAINDINTSNDNSWCGDGHIIMILPTAAGDVTQLTPSSGSSNWSLVDERPPSGADYVTGSAVDSYDLYNLSDVALTGNTITRIIPMSVSVNNIASGGRISLGIKPSGGSEDWSPDRQLTLAYNDYVGSEYLLNPNGNVPWDTTSINSLQVGVKIRP